MNQRLSILSFSRFAFALLFLLWLLFSSAPPAYAANWSIHTQPTRLVNGGPVLFQVQPPARLESLHGTWLGHEVSFSFDAASKTWFALAGVSLETAPGTYSLELTGKLKRGKPSARKFRSVTDSPSRAASIPKSKPSSMLKASSPSPTPSSRSKLKKASKSRRTI